METMNLDEARKIIVADMVEQVAPDFFENSPENAEAFEKEVIDYALDTVSLKPSLGATVFVHEGDTLSDAYYMVLVHRESTNL